MLQLFFFNDTATTEIYTLSLHDALPISTAPRPPTARSGPLSPSLGLTVIPRRGLWLMRGCGTARLRSPSRGRADLEKLSRQLERRLLAFGLQALTARVLQGAGG